MNKLTAMIARHEGCELMPYRDTVGKLTIGHGHNLDDVAISKEVAELMLSDDIKIAVYESQKFNWFGGLDEVRSAVVVNMVFNMGLPVFSGFKKTIGFIESGEYDEAAAEMLDSKWRHQVGNRAIELSEMMRTGEWSESTGEE